MNDRTRWILVLLGCATLLALLMQGPQWVHMLRPEYRGIPVQLNSDEEVYRARVQEALSGRPEMAAEAFVGEPGLVGTQSALLEAVEGRLFAWTGLRAPELLQLMDSVVPVLLFLAVVAYYFLCGFPRWTALSGAAAFALLQLYSLNRPVHMRASFLLMLLAMIMVLLALRRRWAYGVIGGALMGVLVGIYFWSFSFVWLWWGIFLAWEIAEWVFEKWKAHWRLKKSRARRLARTVVAILAHLRPQKIGFRFERWHVLFGIGVVGAAAAAPFVRELILLTAEPFYEMGVFRSGMHPSRLPESWAYSALFLGMSVACVAALRGRYGKLRPYRPAIVTAFTAFGFMNQQIIHGTTFNFVSHAIFSLVLAAIGVMLLAWVQRDRWLLFAAALAIIYLAAIGYDGRYVLKQWRVDAEDFEEQHFATLLPVLDALPRSRILSDPETSAFIAGFTKHDVVYSVYLKNVLMTHGEIARRFCLTQLPLSPENRFLERHEHMVHPDANAAFGPEVRAEEIVLVREECAFLDSDPPGALAMYEVEYVLWDRRRQPQWNVARLFVKLQRVARGDGWVLFRIEES